ncbi:hypothetical protein B0H16DRAFT_1557721 [Mycena metata]|uniref:Uncharacterized protein n=1 Tax=Mycena metata TaxID=1033252 RepID=A0AAD7N4V0_9AGAR|nr:hypothetical protein B0H16DRAFT_1557721 [Mycena metata]
MFSTGSGEVGDRGERGGDVNVVSPDVREELEPELFEEREAVLEVGERRGSAWSLATSTSLSGGGTKVALEVDPRGKSRNATGRCARAKAASSGGTMPAGICATGVGMEMVCLRMPGASSLSLLPSLSLVLPLAGEVEEECEWGSSRRARRVRGACAGTCVVAIDCDFGIAIGGGADAASELADDWARRRVV